VSGIRRDSTEFARVAGFSDAIFAIAMTLLVLDIGLEGLPESGGSVRDMLDALQAALPEIVSFAVAFWVIGRYWLAPTTGSSPSSSASTAGSCPSTSSTSASSPSSRSRPGCSATTRRTRSPSSSSRSRWRGEPDGARPGRPCPPRGPAPGGRARGHLDVDEDRLARPGLGVLVSIPIGFVDTTAALLSWLVAPVGFLVNRRMPPEVLAYFQRY
jgi:hypothetical protein